MSRPIRVLLVDDHTLVRQGIRALLEPVADIEIVDEADHGHAALRLLERHEVDVVLVELRLPGRDGLATLEAMRARGHAVPALVLTTDDDDELVLAAIREGARGYLLKDVTLDQLASGIRTLAGGRTMTHPAFSARLLRALTTYRAPLATTVAQPQPLTDRELDVLRLAAAGWSNREIASGLHLAEGTVKNYMSAVLFKLGERDRTRAVLRAFERGVLDTESAQRDHATDTHSSGWMPARRSSTVASTGHRGRGERSNR